MTIRLSISGQINALHTASTCISRNQLGAMRPNERELLVKQLKACMGTLQFCEEHLPEIREFMATKKARQK